MKKQFFILIVLCLCCLTIAAACENNDGCEHVVGDLSWQTTQQPTCVATGIEEGICSICYENVTRVKEIDPNAHQYGNWNVSNPTREANGTASTTCALCGNVHNATLPKLDDVLDQTNYKSTSITTRPTAAKEGVRTYVYEDSIGDITFNVAIPSNGITSLRDAVEIASMEESKSYIRKAEGQMGFEYYIGTSASGKYGLDDFSYEFGDNYTHLVDGIDDCERWYFTDTTTDGNGNTVTEYYGLTDFGGSLRDEYSTNAGSKHYLEGSRLYFEYCLGLGYFYGAENLLDGLYRAAISSTNDDYQETVDATNNVYKFSFGSLTLSGSSSQYFSIIAVEFTFTDTLAIKTLDAICTTYVNNSHSGIKTWAIDEETGIGYVIEGQELGDRYISEIHIDQTAKTEGDVVPVNPYSCENMFISSFEIYDTKEEVTLTQGVPAYITANVATQARFEIRNILPVTAESMLLDSFSFYYRTKDSHGNNIDTPIDYVSLDSIGVNAYYSPTEKTLSIKTTTPGEITIVIKTEKYFEYELVLASDEKVPSKLYPSLLTYANSVYSQQEFTTNSVTTAIEIAVGQPIYFKARVDKDYESAQFTPSVTGINTSNASFTTAEIEKNTNITEGHLAKDITSGKIVDNYQYHSFEANTKGTYTIKLTSTLSKSKTATFKVKVVDAPTVEEICANTYTQTLEYPTAGTVTVSLALATGGDLPATLEDDTDYYVATITFNGMTEYLLCKFQVPPSHIVGGTNATYENNRKYITSSHLRGAEQGFSLEWNEAYDLELTHPTGFGTLTETVVLNVAVAE